MLRSIKFKGMNKITPRATPCPVERTVHENLWIGVMFGYWCHGSKRETGTHLASLFIHVKKYVLKNWQNNFA